MSGPLAATELDDQPLSVQFFAPASAFAMSRLQGRSLLATLGFGVPRPATLPAAIPFVSPDLPVLLGDGVLEAWHTAERPAYETLDGVACASTPSVLFGALELAEADGAPLERTTYAAYDRIFTLLERRGYPYLLRVWNYFPGITTAEHGLERYQQFSLARHQAFLDHRRTPETAPAASAVGSRCGPLTVLFLAGRQAGTPLENPRQVSAYHYPERYGPRSPTFSRAVLSRAGGPARLYVSGTASILGHESVHLGDPGAQTEEAFANIAALRDEAIQRGFSGGGARYLKVYVRDPHHLDVIRARLGAHLGPEDHVVFLLGELCRSELLVEIEGVCG